jgi:hypothetical protein
MTENFCVIGGYSGRKTDDDTSGGMLLYFFSLAIWMACSHDIRIRK